MKCQVTGRDSNKPIHDAIATHWNIVQDADGKEIRRYAVCLEHSQYISTATYANGLPVNRIESL